MTSFPKNVKKKKKVVHLRLLFTYLHQNLFNIRNILPWCLKKITHVVFCVFQTDINKAVNILCTLPEWIRKMQMIQCFSTMKTCMTNSKAEKWKSNKGNFTFSTHRVPSSFNNGRGVQIWWVYCNYNFVFRF